MILSKDEQGAEMVIARKGDLEDFPKFIDFLRRERCGATTGILKVRLHKDDRNDEESMKRIMPFLQARFADTVLVNEDERGRKCRRKRVPAFNVALQKTLKGAISEHIYEYVQEESSTYRQAYVDHALNPTSYKPTENCCTNALAAGLSCARTHFFEEIEKRSAYTPELLQVGVQSDASQRVTYEPILYAAGIRCLDDLHIAIGDVLDMSKLGTILDKLDRKWDGVAYPYLYCGTCHSFFCWHIEDGALCSINYLISGGSKMWFATPPKYFGLSDHIAQGFRINKAHSVCRALLVDHKSALYDPEYMWKQHGIPYSMMKQDPGDFVITWPYTLHAGFNTSTNMAIAVNFADVDWIEEGIYAPVCGCKEVVNLDLTPILQLFKPGLLQTWREAASVTFPPNHPRSIVQPLNPGSQMDTMQEATGGASHDPNKQSSRKRTVTMYECPQHTCATVYSEHKDRLKSHIRKTHPSEATSLLEEVERKHPSKAAPKTVSVHICPVCGCSMHGSVSHLERHMKLQLQSAKLDLHTKAKYEEELAKLNSVVKRRKKHQKALH